MSDAHNLFEYEGCDTTTLARKENPQTSKDAAEKMVKSGALNRQEKWIYNLIMKYVNSHPLERDKTFTTKDIAGWTRAYAYDKAYDICRKRFSGLRDKGKIELTGGRRDGCRVWRLK